jgi:YaiO family outer membrane protein
MSLAYRVLVGVFLFNLVVLSSFSQDTTAVAANEAPHAIADTLPPPQEMMVAFPNSVEAGFRYEGYAKDYNNRTFFYAQYGRRIKQVDLFGRVLRYSLGSRVGYQYETDAYWTFKKRGYAYFAGTYSNSELLPNYRLRAEVFQNVKSFEYSVGAGLMKPFNFDVIPLFTGTLGYYFGDYYVYGRPTFSYVDGWTRSFMVHGRKYFTKTDFVGFTALKGADTGTSRDLNSVANQFGNDTYLIRFNAQMKKGRYKFGGGLDYGGIYIPERSEYAQFVGFDVFINREF